MRIILAIFNNSFEAYTSLKTFFEQRLIYAIFKKSPKTPKKTPIFFRTKIKKQ